MRGRARACFGMSNFGSKGAMLVTDIAQSAKGSIPPYNDEPRAGRGRGPGAPPEHLRPGRGHPEDGASPDEAAGRRREHPRTTRRCYGTSVRCWCTSMSTAACAEVEVGTGLPEVVAENLSHSERAFFTQYAALVNKYQGRRGAGLNLTLDPSPPRDHKVQCASWRSTARWSPGTARWIGGKTPCTCCGATTRSRSSRRASSRN